MQKPKERLKFNMVRPHQINIPFHIPSLFTLQHKRQKQNLKALHNFDPHHKLAYIPLEKCILFSLAANLAKSSLAMSTVYCTALASTIVSSPDHTFFTIRELAGVWSGDKTSIINKEN